MALCGEPSMAVELDDIMKCSICSEVYNDPRILPCIHTFCLKCIEETGTSSTPGDRVACPICREEFIIPQKGFADLQKNVFMSRVIKVQNIMNPLVREKFCDLCWEDNEDYPVPFAESFCVECQQSLCKECCHHHRKNKVSKGHTVVSFGTQMNADALAAAPSLCAQHPTKQLEMLCTECHAVICMKCFAENHQFHMCVDVNRLVPQFKDTMKEDVEKISARKAEMGKEKEMIGQADIDLVAEFSTAETAVIKRGEELKQLIDHHTDLLLTDLAVLRTLKAKEIDTEREEMDQHIALLDSYSTYCLSVAEKGSAAEICQASKELHDRATALETAHKRGIVVLENNSLHSIFQTSPLQDWLNDNGNLVGKLQDIPVFKKFVRSHALEKTGYRGKVVARGKVLLKFPMSFSADVFSFSKPIAVTKK